MQKELEEACRDTRGITPEELREGAGPPPRQSSIPTKATIKFVSLLKHLRCAYLLYTIFTDELFASNCIHNRNWSRERICKLVCIFLTTVKFYWTFYDC